MDVKLFKRQSTVDECVDTISKCLGVPIEGFKVTASQKGLLFADLKMNNHLIKRDNGASLIPLISLSSKLQDFQIVFNGDPQNEPQSIIILEKDAILSGLVSRSKVDPCSSFKNSILLTGRGFPDRLTKHFTRILSQRFPNAPILGFFDSDVYGFMIALEYKLKPFNLQTQEPCCSEMQINGAKLFQNVTSEADLINLTDKDVQMSFSLLCNLEKLNLQTLDGMQSAITNLQRCLFFGIKRELKLNDVYA